MSVVVAVLVGFALAIGGGIGGIWRITGALSRQADKVGVGQLRGGLLVARFRIPLLLWSATLIAAGLILGIAWRDRTAVIVALLAGAAVAAVAVFVLPKHAPGLAMRGVRGVRRRVGARLRRR